MKYSPRVDSFPGVFGTSIGGGILRQTGLSASRVERGERASGAAALGRLERRVHDQVGVVGVYSIQLRPKIYFTRRPAAALLGCAL